MDLDVEGERCPEEFKNIIKKCWESNPAAGNSLNELLTQSPFVSIVSSKIKYNLSKKIGMTDSKPRLAEVGGKQMN